MKLQGKIFLIIAIPILVMLYFLASNISEEIKVLDELKDTSQLSHLSIKLSLAIHEMQKERGRTSGFIGSNGTLFVTELDDQREITDIKIQDLKSFLEDFNVDHYGPEFKNKMTLALGALSSVKEHRSTVSSLNISYKDAIGSYTNTISLLLDAIEYLPKTSSNSEIINLIDGYVNFLKAKESVGIERAVGTNTIAADKFTQGFYVYFISLASSQDAYFDSFKTRAEPQEIKYYIEKISDPSIAEAQRMREILLEKGGTGGFGLKSSYWFDTMTKKIDILKEVEDKISSDIGLKANQLEMQSRHSLRKTILISIVSFLACIVLTAYLIQKSITHPINQLTKIVGDISTGKLDIQIDSKIKSSNDELGALAKAFDRTIVSLKLVMKENKDKNEEDKQDKNKA